MTRSPDDVFVLWIDNAANDPVAVATRLIEAANAIMMAREVPAMYQTIRDPDGLDVGRYAVKPPSTRP